MKRQERQDRTLLNLAVPQGWALLEIAMRWDHALLNIAVPQGWPPLNIALHQNRALLNSCKASEGPSAAEYCSSQDWPLLTYRSGSGPGTT